jgi:hypothetical protein
MGKRCQHADATNGARLLCPRGRRPRSGRATADKYDEFPSPHGFARAEDHIGYEKKISHFGSGIVPFVITKQAAPMPALGQKQTLTSIGLMPALLPKANMDYQDRDIRFVPTADIAPRSPDLGSRSMFALCQCREPFGISTCWPSSHRWVRLATVTESFDVLS